MSISFNCEIKAKYNYNRFKEIEKRLPAAKNKCVEEILKNIQITAIRLEKGHNEQGIIVEMIETSTMKVKGRTYAKPEEFVQNGQSYLWFEYFGTGEFAEQDHIGKTKHFIESGFAEWFIPVNKVDRALSYPIKTINGQQFYVATGAKSNHFLEDSEFETRNQNRETVKNIIDNMLKEVCK